MDVERNVKKVLEGKPERERERERKRERGENKRI